MLQDLRFIMTHCTFDHEARTVRAETSVRLLGTKHNVLHSLCSVQMKIQAQISMCDIDQNLSWDFQPGTFIDYVRGTLL